MNKCPNCGREFKTIQALKSHLRSEEAKRILEENRPSEYVCETCGKHFTEDWRKDPNLIRKESPRFCCKACAHSRHLTKESKLQISETLLRHCKEPLPEEYDQLVIFKNKLRKQKRKERETSKKKARKCIICGQTYFNTDEQETKKVFKGMCKSCSLKAAGRKSSSVRGKTSKAERAFRKLCESENWIVKHNEAMFNGFDADIILPEFKLAIHWNGPWHYEGYIKDLKDYSWKQTHNRDLIKYKEIEKAGYTNYIIKDTEHFSKEKVENEFKKLKEYLAE